MSRKMKRGVKQVIQFRKICIFVILTGSLCFIFNCDQKNDQNRISSVQTSGAILQHENRYTFIRELPMDPQYLNPLLSSDAPSSTIQSYIFDSLLGNPLENDADFEPRLAKSWEVSDDGKDITFYLRDYIQWHDGTSFTADDVVFTFKAAMDPSLGAPGMAGIVEHISDVQKIDRTTVTFHFKYPFSPKLEAVGAVYIVPQHLLDQSALARETSRKNLKTAVTIRTAEFNSHPVGTGPFVFQEWKRMSHVRMTRFHNYWDSPQKGNIESVMVKIIPNKTLSYSLLVKADLDYMRCQALQFIKFERDKKLHELYRAVSFYRPSYYFIGWNNRKSSPFFSDSVVRKSMTCSLNREAFIEKAMYGLGQIVTGPFYFNSWAYNQEIKPIPFDLKQAMTLLESAGWKDHNGDGVLDKNGRNFEFDIIINSGSPGTAQLASILQANLKEIGIIMSIQVFEWSVFLERVRNAEFDAFIGGWFLGVDPDIFSIWHSSQIEKGNNNIGFDNANVDKLIEAGRTTGDRQTRKNIYHKIHEILHEEQPVTFVYTRKETYILSKRLTDVQLTPYGFTNFSQWNLNPVALPPFKATTWTRDSNNEDIGDDSDFVSP